MNKRDKHLTQPVKTIPMKPKDSSKGFKAGLVDVIDVIVALTLVDGAVALWNRPVLSTLFGDVKLHRVSAAVLILLVVYMFLSGKRYRNR